ncbi:MAG: hypothetical protein HC773_16515 [Scytonema sp. CRU_2_7]|nr:hypothetical protein [Scytonema sp. CRU_2_7]
MSYDFHDVGTSSYPVGHLFGASSPEGKILAQLSEMSVHGSFANFDPPAAEEGKSKAERRFYSDRTIFVAKSQLSNLK